MFISLTLIVKHVFPHFSAKENKKKDQKAKKEAAKQAKKAKKV